MTLSKKRLAILLTGSFLTIHGAMAVTDAVCLLGIVSFVYGIMYKED